MESVIAHELMHAWIYENTKTPFRQSLWGELQLCSYCTWKHSIRTRYWPLKMLEAIRPGYGVDSVNPGSIWNKALPDSSAFWKDNPKFSWQYTGSTLYLQCTILLLQYISLIYIKFGIIWSNSSLTKERGSFYKQIVDQIRFRYLIGQSSCGGAASTVRALAVQLKIIWIPLPKLQGTEIRKVLETQTGNRHFIGSQQSKIGAKETQAKLANISSDSERCFQLRVTIDES